MKPTETRYNYIHLASGLGLIVSFFLPWTQWKDDSISGYQFPSGRFFAVSTSKFNFPNPFPQLEFSFYIFWLIPVLTAIALILTLQNKKDNWPALVAGA